MTACPATIESFAGSIDIVSQLPDLVSDSLDFLDFLLKGVDFAQDAAYSRNFGIGTLNRVTGSVMGSIDRLFGSVFELNVVSRRRQKQILQAHLLDATLDGSLQVIQMEV